MDNSWLPSPVPRRTPNASARRVRALFRAANSTVNRSPADWVVDPADIAIRANAQRSSGRPSRHATRGAWPGCLSEPDRAAIHLASSDPSTAAGSAAIWPTFPFPNALPDSSLPAPKPAVCASTLESRTGSSATPTSASAEPSQPQPDWAGLSESGRPRIYIATDAEAAIRSKYRLVEDDDGNGGPGRRPGRRRQRRAATRRTRPHGRGDCGSARLGRLPRPACRRRMVRGGLPRSIAVADGRRK